MATATKHTSPVNVEHRKSLDIRAGDTVRVWTKVVEKGKTRLQPFEGMVLARKHGSEPGATFTVRKVSSGVGIERIFPLYSPNIDKIELVRRAKTRRSKLYYIREKAAKQIRRKMKAVTLDVPDLTAGEAMPEEEEQKPASADGRTESASGETQSADGSGVAMEETQSEEEVNDEKQDNTEAQNTEEDAKENEDDKKQDTAEAQK